MNTCRVIEKNRTQHEEQTVSATSNGMDCSMAIAGEEEAHRVGPVHNSHMQSLGYAKHEHRRFVMAMVSSIKINLIQLVDSSYS